MEDIKYKGGSIVLEEGDKIFQYTDGVTEATNGSNELYGRERLNVVLNENSTKAPCEILESVSLGCLWGITYILVMFKKLKRYWVKLNATA